MALIKKSSCPCDLNKCIEIDNILPVTPSFNDFEKLILSGSQKILSFGEYSQKKNGIKENKKKVIKYTYNKLLSKL